MTKWDYQILKVDKFDNKDLLVKLKEAGLDGWELIQIMTYNSQSLDLAILKKPFEKRGF